MNAKTAVFTAVLTAALMLMAAVGVGAQTPIPWFSYSPPESFFMGLDATGNYQYFNDQFADDRGNVNKGTLKLRFWQFSDGPEYGYDINASVLLQTRDSAEDRILDFDFNSGGHTSFKYYLMPDDDFFGYAGLVGSATAGGYSLVGNAGVGYGRFKDVTPLGRAAWLERELMAVGDVVQPFGPAVLIGLAQEMERVPELEETAYEKTERVADFIIENAPGSPQLSPAGVIAVDMVLTNPVPRRSVGWEARAGIGYPIILPAGQERSIQLVASGSLGMPISYTTQVNVTGQATTPLNSILTVYNVGIQGDVIHAVTEDIDVGGNASVNLVGGDNNILAWSIGGVAEIKLIDSLNLVVDVNMGNSSEWEEMQYGLNLSLRYRFF